MEVMFPKRHPCFIDLSKANITGTPTVYPGTNMFALQGETNDRVLYFYTSVGKYVVFKQCPSKILWVQFVDTGAWVICQSHVVFVQFCSAWKNDSSFDYFKVNFAGKYVSDGKVLHITVTPFPKIEDRENDYERVLSYALELLFERNANIKKAILHFPVAMKIEEFFGTSSAITQAPNTSPFSLPSSLHGYFDHSGPHTVFCVERNTLLSVLSLPSQSKTLLTTVMEECWLLMELYRERFISMADDQILQFLFQLVSPRIALMMVEQNISVGIDNVFRMTNNQWISGNGTKMLHPIPFRMFRMTLEPSILRSGVMAPFWWNALDFFRLSTSDPKASMFSMASLDPSSFSLDLETSFHICYRLQPDPEADVVRVYYKPQVSGLVEAIKLSLTLLEKRLLYAYCCYRAWEGANYRFEDFVDVIRLWLVYQYVRDRPSSTISHTKTLFFPLFCFPLARWISQRTEALSAYIDLSPKFLQSLPIPGKTLKTPFEWATNGISMIDESFEAKKRIVFDVIKTLGLRR